MRKPITPMDVSHEIPDKVIEAFDTAIQEKWDGWEASFTLDYVTNLAESLGVNREEGFEKRWFDVETLYRLAGWEVTYRNQGFRDEQPSMFCFRKRK